MSEGKTLGEEYPKELQRCKELLEMYKEIGAPGRFGAAMIAQVIIRSEKAQMDQDLVAMLQWFKEMEECQ